MAAIALAVLQILLLLLKAYFAKDQDKERVIEHLKAAQAALDSVASQFETAIRYSHPKSELVDQVQDQLDEDIKNHRSIL
jgi:exonuclease VII small subunit